MSLREVVVVGGSIAALTAVEMVRLEDFDGRMVISSDPDRHRAYIQQFVDLGFDRIYLHNVARDHQERFIEQCGARLLPSFAATQ